MRRGEDDPDSCSILCPELSKNHFFTAIINISLKCNFILSLKFCMLIISLLLAEVGEEFSCTLEGLSTKL